MVAKNDPIFRKPKGSTEALQIVSQRLNGLCSFGHVSNSIPKPARYLLARLANRQFKYTTRPLKWSMYSAAALGGVLLLANWPYTLLVMASTNRALAATADQDAGPATRARIVTWGKLHAVRTCLGIAGAGAFVCASFLT
jgi:hypothetical protein